MGRKVKTLCRLGEACRRKGLSVEQAGVLAGVGQDRAYRLSRGECEPKQAEKDALVAALGVPADALWPEVRVGSKGAAAALVALFSSAEGQVLAGRLLVALQGVEREP